MGVTKTLGIALSLLGLHACAVTPFGGLNSFGVHKGILGLEKAGFVEYSPARLPVRSWIYSMPHETAPVIVVFESDGAPWRGGGFIPPQNPTPYRAVGAEIATALAAHFGGPVVYVGRHCQYIDANSLLFQRHCGNTRLWAQARFAPEVVSEISGWLEFLRGQVPNLAARPWVLTGFSGGGTLATLVATELPDTACLVSFAAPLDLAQWVGLHRLTPLYESLDPADLIDRLRRLPAWGVWLGGDDRVVSAESAGRFWSVAGQRPELLRVLTGYGHWPADPWIDSAAKHIQESCALVFDWSRL